MRCNILVVSLSYPDIDTITESLIDYPLLIVPNALEAIHYIEEEKQISIVIIDFSLPNNQAIELLEILNSTSKYSYIRTIILTRQDHLDDEIIGLKLGASDYIRKPIQKESFVVRMALNIAMIQQEKLELKHNENKLLFDVFFWQAPLGISIGQWRDPFDDTDVVLLDINPMFEQITGRTKEELKSVGWASITHPEDLKIELEKSIQLQSGKISSYSMEKRYIKPDGSLVWVHLIVAPFSVISRPTYTHICLIQDISKRKEMEMALTESERSKAVFLSNFPGMAYRCNYDKYWTMQFISDGCFDLTGYLPENLLNNRDIAFSHLIATEYHESIWKEWERVIALNQPFKSEYEIITADGSRKWVWEMGQGVTDTEGKVVALEGVLLDISDRKRIEQEILYRNDHDSRTGLYNFNSLKRIFTQERVVPTHHKSALVAVDLSSVHSLSTIFGFQYTQDLIKNTTDHLKNHCYKGCDLFYAYEFRLIYYVRNYSDKKELEALCQTISQTLESLLTIERIGWGIGIIELDLYKNLDLEHLLRYLMGASEIALKEYNTSHINYRFFDQSLEALIDKEEKITAGLIDITVGKNRETFFLQFQPIVDLKLNKITGFEALARFDSPKIGKVPPLEFIPIAEKTKLIIPLGKRIIELSLLFLLKLKRSGYNSITVSINISVIQLLHKNFVDSLLEMIESMDIQPSDVILEITESIFALEIQEVRKILVKLQNSGLKIALDDFGTGYSSLARGRELNVDYLKIDKLFIDKLVLLKEEVTITDDVISMAHKLGYLAIAEGVEHKEQKQYLEKHGCDKIQGYLISRPLDEEAAISFIKKYEDGGSQS